MCTSTYTWVFLVSQCHSWVLLGIFSIMLRHFVGGIFLGICWVFLGGGGGPANIVKLSSGAQ